MPSKTDFNVSPYYDDFNETKKFHRVMYRPAYAVQARELTTQQSITQNQIEKMGEVAAWENRIMKTQEKIDELTKKMTVAEGDDVKEYINEKAVKDTQRDIKLLEKKKALYEKQKNKAAKKVSNKPEMQTATGEDTTVMEKEEPFTPPADPIGDTVKASLIRTTAPKPKKESWTGMVRELINTKNLRAK